MQKIVVPIVVGVVMASIGFFGGTQYSKSKQPTFPGQSFGNFQRNGTMGANRGNGNTRGGTFANGEVLSKDEKSVTIKSNDGGSRIIFLSNSTTIMTATKGSLNDITTGTPVTITGSSNSDGSITAQTIQIRSQMSPAARP